MKRIGAIIIFTLLALSTISTFSSFASAGVFIGSVNSEKLTPGERARIKIYVENELSSDISDVSLELDLTNLPLSSEGSTEDSVKKIQSSDKEDFNFILRASSNAKPGDYNVPYTLTYDNSTVKTGTIGVTVTANATLSYSLDTKNPIIGERGEIILKIVNKGLADARFVSIKVLPLGYTSLSESDIYIGEINSDDFETETFDVIFTSANPILSIFIEYTDFDNQVIQETANLPITVYSQEKALELGIKSKSNTRLYLGSLISLLLIWFIWRKISKTRRQKRRAGR